MVKTASGDDNLAQFDGGRGWGSFWVGFSLRDHPRFGHDTGWLVHDGDNDRERGWMCRNWGTWPVHPGGGAGFGANATRHPGRVPGWADDIFVVRRRVDSVGSKWSMVDIGPLCRN